MWRRVGILAWGVLSAFSTMVGIGGWADEAAVWRGWIKGMDPTLSGFLMGAGSVAFVWLLSTNREWFSAYWSGALRTITDRTRAIDHHLPENPKSTADNTAITHEVPNLNTEREWCPLSPQQLCDLCRERTEMDRRKIFTPYVGLFLEVRGKVSDVGKPAGTKIHVTVDISDEVSAVVHMKDDPHEEYLGALLKGDKFAALGRFQSALPSSRGPGGVVSWNDGELRL